MIKLGKKVKCIVTGFTGVATCRAEYLNGCVQYGVRPPVDKDGKMIDVEYIDEGKLRVVGEGILVELEAPKVEAEDEPGGPQACPQGD